MILIRRIITLEIPLSHLVTTLEPRSLFKVGRDYIESWIQQDIAHEVYKQEMILNVESQQIKKSQEEITKEMTRLYEDNFPTWRRSWLAMDVAESMNKENEKKQKEHMKMIKVSYS